MGRFELTQTEILCIAAEVGRIPAEGKCDNIDEDKSHGRTRHRGGNNGGATTGRQIPATVRRIAMSTETTATPPEIGWQQLPQRRQQQQQSNDEQPAEEGPATRVPARATIRVTTIWR